MSSSAHSRAYFGKLAQYATEEKLIGQMLIPAASAKIDREARTGENSGHILRFQNETSSYIDPYKSNQSRIRQLKTLNAFAGTIEEFHTQAVSLREEYQDVQNTKGSLAAFGASVDLAIEQFEQDDQSAMRQIASVKGQIKKTEHERLSVKCHALNCRYEQTMVIFRPLYGEGKL